MALSDRSKAGVLDRWVTLRTAHDPIEITVDLGVYERDGEDAKRVETRRLAHLLLDPKSGLRKFRTEENAQAFDEVAASFDTVPIALTCHRGQLEAIESPAKVVGLLGGARGGKSEVLVILLLLAWIHRGRVEGESGSRPGLYWWVGPTLEKAFRVGAKKMATIIPPALRGPMPRNSRSIDLAVSMIDGCRIEFHHANGDGDNLKGEAIQAVACDEITSWNDPANWRIINDRTLDTGGPVFVGSTPKSGHWSREEIILRARDIEDVGHFEISQFDNPWISPREIWKNLQVSGALTPAQVKEIMAKHQGLADRATAARETIDDPLTLREVFGQWVADGLVLYNEFDIDHVVDTEHPPEGTEWITDFVVLDKWRSFKGSTTEFVGGQDWNVNPMTTVICRVFGKRSDKSTWGLLAVDEVQTRGDVATHGLNLQRRYGGFAIACDSHGALPGTPASHGATGSMTNAKILSEAGFDTRACNFKKSREGRIYPQNPSQIDSVNLTNRLLRQRRLLVHRRCTELRIGLQTAQRASDGSIFKVSNTKLDRLSAAPDALRYLVWRLFSSEWRKGASEWRLSG